MAIVEGDMRGRERLDDAAGGCGNNVHLCLFAVAKSARMMRHPVQGGSLGLVVVRGDTRATHRLGDGADGFSALLFVHLCLFMTVRVEFAPA